MKKLLTITAGLIAMPVMGATPFEIEQAEYINGYTNEINYTFWLMCFLLWVVIFGALGMWIGSYRRRGKEGAFLSAMLGPIGMVIVLLLPMGPEKSQSYPFSFTFRAEEMTLILYGLLGISALLLGFILYVNYLDVIYDWLH